jgi:MFS family permease
VLAERHLTGASRFGLLFGAIGVGAGLGPLVIQRLVVDVRRARWLYGPYVLLGLVDLALAVTTNFSEALGALAVYGIGASTGIVAYSTILQTAVPDRIRGRVFAFCDLVWQTFRLVSIAVGGVIADAYTITFVYFVGGTIVRAAGLLGITQAGRPPTAARRTAQSENTADARHGVRR